MRPLLFDHPEDETTYTADDEFLVGDALLVAPITRPGLTHRHVYLPEGTWFHLWTSERFEGPRHILAHAPLGEPAIYAKANIAIPMWPEMNRVSERPADPLTLVLYPSEGSGSSTLYEDAGDGFGYENGEYARRTVRCEASGDRITVTVGEREGSFAPERERMVLELRGVESDPQNVTVNGEAADWSREGTVLLVNLTEGADATTVEVRI
jgi:alpha-glucosidase